MSEPNKFTIHTGAKDWREVFVKTLNSPDVLKHLKREFDRSFAITLEETGNKVKVSFMEQDSGRAVMTVADVAIFLQTDRASVRRLTEKRAQRRAKHPLPFVKLGGKMLRFNRPDVEAWWGEVCRNGDGPSFLALSKGKVGKTK